MNPIDKLHSLGQSIWYDNIERRLINNGELAKMIENKKIRGITSNPSIFNNAISKSNDYDDSMAPLAEVGKNKFEVYEALAIEDIKDACDLFLPLYTNSEGGDGYVSLEISPYLAGDTQGSITDSRRLWELVNRPNLMIKIPATQEGIPAIKEVIAEGINVNVTLIFSINRYLKVIDAYLSGLEQRLDDGLPVDKISSVASFFVSRIDSNVDEKLQTLVKADGESGYHGKNLLGKIAVSNAKLAFELHKEEFQSDRFGEIKAEGGRVQRVLWASTSTKNPSYPDTKYIDDLIGPGTINTVPPKTLVAFEDHGSAKITLDKDLQEAKEAMKELADVGISISDVTKELEEKGVKSFADDFTSLLESVEKRRLAVL